MKRRIFLVCLFYCFFRLPIYESIAAIFWQSASYVYNSKDLNCIGALSLKICSHILMIFEVKLEYLFGHAKTGSWAKKWVILWREFFSY